MDKSRIITKGTDIRLKFKLGELNEFDVTSVKQMRCYLIKHEDKSFEEKIHNCNFPQFYHPTEYTMSPNIYGNQMFTYYNPYFSRNAMFGKVSDYHMFPSYNGFGVYSKKFVNTHTDYLCPSKLLPEWSAAECYFPAEDQRFIGVFDLIVTVTLYQRGWGEDNLRTYTIRKNEVFELIEGPSTASGNIDLDKETPKLVGIEMNTSNFEITDIIKLGDTDIDGKKLLIRMNYSDGSSIVYNGQTDIRIVTGTERLVFDKDNLCFRINGIDLDEEVSLSIYIGDKSTNTIMSLKRKRKITLEANHKFKMNGPTTVTYGKSAELTVYSEEGDEHFNIIVQKGGVDITNSINIQWHTPAVRATFTVPNITQDITVEASV